MDNLKPFIAPARRKKSSDLSVIILASLSIHRSKTLGAVSMLPVGNQPLLFNQVNAIRSTYPLSDIYTVVGYHSSQVINNKPDGIRIIENQLHENTGNAEEIRLALNASLNNRALIIGGNVMFDQQAIKQIQNHASCILVGNENPDSHIGSVNSSGKLEILSYGLKNRWYNVAMLEENELAIAKKFIARKERERYLFHEIINYVVMHGGKINVVKSTVGNIRTIDSSKDI